MLHIDLAKAKELLSAAIYERGADYVYPYDTCVYWVAEGEEMAASNDPHGSTIVPKTEPGCLIGLAMHLAGVDADIVRMRNEGEDVNGLLAHLRDEGAITYTEKAERYLKNAQTHQDNGKTWGDAKYLADNYVDENDYLWDDVVEYKYY